MMSRGDQAKVLELKRLPSHRNQRNPWLSGRPRIQRKAARKVVERHPVVEVKGGHEGANSFHLELSGNDILVQRGQVEHRVKIS